MSSIVESKMQATMLVIPTPKVESTNLGGEILGEGALTTKNFHGTVKTL